MSDIKSLKVSFLTTSSVCEEYETSYKLLFLFDKPASLVVFGKEYPVCGVCVRHELYDGETPQFHYFFEAYEEHNEMLKGIPISRKHLLQIYKITRTEEKPKGKLHDYCFADEIREMLEESR